MAKKDEKTIFDYLYDYQTRLQGVANDLGIRFGALMISSDAKILKLLRSELPKHKVGQKELDRLEKLVSKIEAVRNPTYSAAQDMVLETSADIVQAATSEIVKEFNQIIAEHRRKIREKHFCKELTKKQQESVIEGQGIDGATVADWFWKWKRGDLERLSSLAKRASVESMTVSQITRAAKGTIENNYDDGVFTETRVSAARMARTIINGVSNNARAETIVQNSDAIDGVKFVGTLDGKTCPYCASYDGYIWRGEEIAEARRPPIHPNCRCCLIPYVELKDEEGNVVDVDGERHAANADFDKLAQDAYNEHAREKGWKRRWDDLSPSTRLKYFYQAQKDYEERTGKPAYRQVSGATTFQEYFHRQPDSFKRAWLGAKRYELYKAGTLKEKNIFKPDMTYQVSVESLVRDGVRDSLRSDLNNQALSIKETRRKRRNASTSRKMASEPEKDGLRRLTLKDGESFVHNLLKGDESFDKGKIWNYVLGRTDPTAPKKTFVEQDSINNAETFIKKELNIDADYDKLPLDVANDCNQELIRAFNIFGTVGIVNDVKVDNERVNGRIFAAFDPKTFTILLRSDRNRTDVAKAMKEAWKGCFSTRSHLHPYRHEIGHAIWEYLTRVDDSFKRRMSKAYDAYFDDSKIGQILLSWRACKSPDEMFAEAIAELMNGNPRDVSKMILNKSREGNYDF